MSNQDGTAATPSRPPSTRTELDARLAARPVPQPQQQHTQGGWDETEIHRQVREDGERRIAELRERLAISRDRLEHAYAFSALEGHAKADFGRER